MGSSRRPPTSCALRLGKPNHPTMPLEAVVAKRVEYASSFSRLRRPPRFRGIGSRRSARTLARRRRFRATTRVSPGHLPFDTSLRPWEEPKRHSPCNGSNRYVEAPRTLVARLDAGPAVLWRVGLAEPCYPHPTSSLAARLRAGKTRPFRTLTTDVSLRAPAYRPIPIVACGLDTRPRGSTSA
jgi:hypothetical protein